MAERRMFAKTIVLSDAFLDMPLSARCLYFTLGMFADDDGFVNNPKSIMRQCGASQDDMKILFAKKFLLSFETGVIVIKHWKINNYLRSDRYKETTFTEEKKQLVTKKNGAYSFGIPHGIPSIGKDSIDKVSIEHVVVIDEQEEKKEEEEQQPQQQQTKSKRFKKPTVEEIKAYCDERKNGINAEYFYDYYESKGWQIGKNPMKDWQAAVRTWERKDFKGGVMNESISSNKRNDDKFDREKGWF